VSISAPEGAGKGGAAGEIITGCSSRPLCCGNITDADKGGPSGDEAGLPLWWGWGILGSNSLTRHKRGVRVVDLSSKI
jgi:hypothetical protein